MLKNLLRNYKKILLSSNLIPACICLAIFVSSAVPSYAADWQKQRNDWRKYHDEQERKHKEKQLQWTADNKKLQEEQRKRDDNRRYQRNIQDDYDRALASVPEDFNTTLYYFLNPDFNHSFAAGQARAAGVNLPEKSDLLGRWHYAKFGRNEGRRYMPEDFNPELYMILNPGIKVEALRLNKDPVAYAKYYYAVVGYKTPEVRYLPEDFNPELYMILNPGIRAEALRLNKDPVAYSKYYYAVVGYRHPEIHYK